MHSHATQHTRPQTKLHPEPIPPTGRPSVATRYAIAARQLLRAAIVLYGLGVTAFLLARLLVGERWTPVAFANNFLFWWALGNLAASGIALFMRQRWRLIALQLPGLLAFLLVYHAVLLPRSSASVLENAPHLRMVTYNILGSASDPAEIARVITDLDADIVGLEELGPDHAAYFETQLAGDYPYQVHYPRLPYHGVGLLSRYPILEEWTFLPQPGSMVHLRAVIDFEGEPVTVYVVHPAPPRNAISPLHYDTNYRDAEIAQLLDGYLRAETGPLVVMGDFNMSDQSDAHDALDALLDDSFLEAGRGLGFSYPMPTGGTLFNGGLMPLIRIDYIWHNAHFAVQSAAVHPSSGTSDHRPAAATLILKQSQKEGFE